MSEVFECTLGALLRDAARRRPDHPALIYSDRDLRYSYGELDGRVTRLAKGLLALGIRRGDHVGIWATNVPDWIVILFATARVGAVMVTVNTNYRPHELEYVLQQSDMKALFTIDGYRDVDYVREIYNLVPELKFCGKGELHSAKFPFLQRVVYIGPKQHRGMFGLDEVFRLGDAVTDAELESATAELNPHDVINMQYTSGTTGFPKGVMLTHHSIINNGFAIGERQRFTPDDRVCLPVPLFHCFGITLGVLAAYTHDATMVPLESYDPLMVLAVVQKERCTALYGVPTMFIAELSHPMFNMFDLNIAPHRDHGRVALSRAGHARGHGEDALPGDHDRIRPYRGFPRHHPDADGRPGRRPGHDDREALRGGGGANRGSRNRGGTPREHPRGTLLQGIQHDEGLL